jgi:hypothetical protein
MNVLTRPKLKPEARYRLVANNGTGFVKQAACPPVMSLEETEARLFSGEYLNLGCFEWHYNHKAIEVTAAKPATRKKK